MANPVPMDSLEFVNSMIAHLQQCLMQTASNGYIDISKGNERVKTVTVEQATKDLQAYEVKKNILEGNGGYCGC